MSTLILVQGPAGAGKSDLTRDMKAAGEIDLVSDNTALWAALGQYERDDKGRYPVRDDNDPALHAARYVQAAAVSFGLREGLDVAVTTSRRDQVARWRGIAEENGARFIVRTVDPGPVTVALRLAALSLDRREARQRPEADLLRYLDPACNKALLRWYEEIGPELEATIFAALEEAYG